MKTRGAVVLLDGDYLCLIERRRAGHTYYLFPGGGTEPGETPNKPRYAKPAKNSASE